MNDRQKYLAEADTILAEAPGRSREDYLAEADEILAPTPGEWLAETAQAFVGGAVRTVSEGLRGAGKLADAMRSIPGMGGTIGSGESVFTAGGEQVERLAPEVDARVANSIPGQIASGLGQVGGLLGIGAVSPIAAAETAFLGGVSETERQVASEMVDEDGGAGLATLLGGGAIGAADMIPVSGVLGRINRVMGGSLSVGALRLAELQKMAASGGALATAGRIAGTAAAEGGTEALQKLAANALANHATDQELDLLRGVAPEGGLGAGVGGLLAGAVELATGKKRAMVVRAAQERLPLETYRERMRTDPEYRASEEIRIQDMIAEDYGTRLNTPAEDAPITDLGGQPVEYVATPEGDFGQIASGQFPTEPIQDPARPREARIRADAAMTIPEEYVGDQPGYSPTGEYRRTESAESEPRSQADPNAPTLSTPSPQPVEYAAQPPTPASSVRAAPSSAAYTPVPGQTGPQGQPVVAITGSREGMQWGGTQENTNGAKSPTSLSDVGRPMLDLGRALGDLSIVERLERENGIQGSFGAGGAMDFGYNDVMAGAHEVGHMIHRWVMSHQTSNSQVATNPNAHLDTLPPAVQGEIRRMAYRGAAPGRELPEGFAELARHWLLAPESARAQAPQATRWLESWVVSQPRNVQASLALIQQRAQDWRFQGDQMRRSVGQPDTLTQKSERILKGLPEAAVRRIWDDTAILKKLDPKLQTLWRAIRTNARGMLTNFVSGRPSDFNGNAIDGGITFEDAMRGIQPKDRPLFDEYLVARMSLALEQKGVSTSKAPAEAKRLVDELDRTHPQFKATLDELTRWWSQINKVLADASPTYKAGLDRIAAHDAKYGIDVYVPLHRWLKSEAGQAWSKGGRRRALMNPVSRDRSGSEYAVKSPTESFVNEARMRLEQAVYRNLIESMIGVYDASGGKQGTKVPWLKEIDAEDAGGTALDFGPEGSVESLLGALGSPEMQGDLIPVKLVDRSGKLRFFRMDRRIAELAAQVDPATLRNGLGFLMKMASAPRRALSTTQVVYNLGFQFWTNLALDLPTAYLTSSYFKPRDILELGAMTAGNVLNNLRAISTKKENAPKWVQAYERLGLQGSAGLHGERQIGRTVTKLSGGRSPTEKGWEAFASFLSIPQRAVQIANMQKAARLHKIDIMQPITADEANILRNAARVGVDYNAGGDLSRKWQMVIPFLRPALDVERQLAESAKRNPIEFFAKAGTLAALYTGIRYLLADDDIEQRKPAVDALRSLTIPTGDGEAVELRVPGEIAWLVLAPMALIESMRENGQDPGDFALGAVRNMLPPGFFSNPAVQTVLSQITNKSDPLASLTMGDAQAPVVPERLENLNGIDQRAPGTAPAAIAFAEMLDKALGGLPQSNPLRQHLASPVRWEAAIRSLLGGNGLAMAEGFGVVPGLAPPVEPEAADLLNGVFRRNGTTSWSDRYIREVYELDRAAKQEKASLQGRYEDPVVAQRREALARTAAALSAARFLATYDSDSMTVEQRRDLTRLAQNAARDAIKALKEGRSPTSYFGLEAQTGARRTMYDIERGAYFR